jgi:hypothetical protein
MTLKGPRRCLHWLLLLTCLLGGSGCGGPNLVPVRGKVIYQNEPVTAAEIYFLPDQAKGSTGVMASSILQEDGTFTMRTHPHGDGVIPGAYKVTVSLGRRVGKALDKYRRGDKTPLAIEVPAEGLTDLVLELK